MVRNNRNDVYRTQPAIKNNSINTGWFWLGRKGKKKKEYVVHTFHTMNTTQP